MEVTNQVTVFHVKIPSTVKNPTWKSRDPTRERKVEVVRRSPVICRSAVAIGKARRSFSIHCFRRITITQTLAISKAAKKPPHHSKAVVYADQGMLRPSGNPS